MGMTAYYTLDLLGTTIETHDEIMKELRTNTNAFYAIDPEGEPMGRIKWDSAFRDVSNISRTYPSVVFLLTEESEEHTKSTKSRIQNGKVLKVWTLGWIEA